MNGEETNMLVYDFHFNKQTEIDEKSIRGTNLVHYHHVIDNKPYEYVIELTDTNGCKWYCNSMTEERLDTYTVFLRDIIKVYEEIA